MKYENLIIISGPSGAGKSTIMNKLLSDSELDIHFSVSVTTRTKRKNEVDGDHYHFFTKEKFLDYIEKDLFIEWAKYADNYYGTLKDEVYSKLESNKFVFLEIELVGVKNILELFPKTTVFFIVPPSFLDLEKRLIERNTDSKVIISKRLQISKDELSEMSMFFGDIGIYKIENKNPTKASDEIKNILKKM